MEYLFILGRNIELSKKEVFSYLKRKEINVKKFSIKENGLLIEADKGLKENAIEELGGVLFIGKVSIKGKLEKELEKIEIYSGTKNNITYVLWNFSSEMKHEKFLEALKKRFKEEKLRASEKRLSGKIKMQEGDFASKIGSKLVDKKYFIFEDENEENYFGEIIEECDYGKIEKRDMNKPVRREELAISPRMAKIMINLSEVKNGPLVDAFCGIGTILYESLLQEISVIGIDKDGKAIVGAKKNLAWGRFDQKKYQLIENDSRKVRISKSEVLVSEPDLGKTWKRVPTDEMIKNQMNGFEEILIKVINNLKNSIYGKIVFSAPLILTKKKGKRKGCDLQKILEETGLRILEGFPIKEYREGQIVGREIFVLEK